MRCMEVAGREVAGTTILAILAGLAGLIATAVFGWDFGAGLTNPLAVVLLLVVAGIAVWVSYKGP